MCKLHGTYFTKELFQIMDTPWMTIDAVLSTKYLVTNRAFMVLIHFHVNNFLVVCHCLLRLKYSFKFITFNCLAAILIMLRSNMIILIWELSKILLKIWQEFCSNLCFSIMLILQSFLDTVSSYLCFSFSQNLQKVWCTKW